MTWRLYVDMNNFMYQFNASYVLKLEIYMFFTSEILLDEFITHCIHSLAFPFSANSLITSTLVWLVSFP